MSTAEWISRQQEKIKKLEQENKPLQIAVYSVMSIQSDRIFRKGLNSDGSLIGDYSKKEIYVSPNQNKGLPKFQTKGKEGSDTFLNGKKHKTGYFTNYLAFKKAVGRSKLIQTVDLFLTGALIRNWGNSESLSDAKPVRVDQNNYQVRLKEENAIKASKYGNVFGLSKTERTTFLKVIQVELTKAMA